MAKVVVEMGWGKSFVLDSEKALTLLEILKDAEVFEEKYSAKTVHIYDNADRSLSMKLLPDSIYRMAKLAGKPEEK